MPREWKVVASRMELEDVSGRVLFPSLAQGAWTPFVRFAETVTTGGEREGEGHSHRHEEVLGYVLEGHVDHEDGAGHRTALGPGAAVLFTAPEEARHNLVPRSTARARWLSVVVQCPPTLGAPGPRVQVAPGPFPTRAGEGTVERHLVGPGGPITSSAGFECTEVEFRTPGRCVCPVGQDRRTVAYVFEGTGSVDGQPLENGTGALLEAVADVALRGEAGTRVLLASAPHG